MYNDYKFDFFGKQDNFDFRLSSGIKDWNAKADFDFFASTSHKVKFGGQYTYHTFFPSVASGNQDSTSFSSCQYAKKIR